MRVGQYIYAKLSATTAVTNLVSSRIYPVYVPQDADLPAIAYRVSNKPKDRGMKDRPADHDESAVTFTYVADVSQGQNGYAALDNIDEAVRDAIDYVSATAGSVTVESCHYDGSDDDIDAERMALTRVATYTFITKNS